MFILDLSLRDSFPLRVMFILNKSVFLNHVVMLVRIVVADSLNDVGRRAFVCTPCEHWQHLVCMDHCFLVRLGFDLPLLLHFN